MCPPNTIPLQFGPAQNSQLFRDESGNLVASPEASLRPRLEDFGTEDFATSFDNLTEPISISSETLFTFLERSEALATRVEQGHGRSRQTKPWVKKRPRDMTPPEQLSSDCENEFADDEERVAKRGEMDDSSYKESSSETVVE